MCPPPVFIMNCKLCKISMSRIYRKTSESYQTQTTELLSKPHNNTHPHSDVMTQ
ncbi:hypothetical protein PGB90_004671 [Kerria lacca]